MKRRRRRGSIDGACWRNEGGKEGIEGELSSTISRESREENVGIFSKS